MRQSRPPRPWLPISAVAFTLYVAQDGQPVIDYELTAQLSFDVPGWMLKRVVRRDSAELI